MSKKAVWYKHKGVRHNNRQLHQHPSHPYPHPRGHWHMHPPTSRIRDRKGRKFRNTPQEHRRTGVKTRYKTRTGKSKRYD